MAPYLKGKPTQFEGKDKARITMLRALSNLPLPTPVLKNTVVVRTQRISLQKNAQWCNEKLYKEDMRERNKATTKEAAKIFADLATGKIKNPKTQQEYGEGKKIREQITGSETLWTGYVAPPVARKSRRSRLKAG